MEGNADFLSQGDYILVPKSAMSYLKIASKAAVIVLLTLASEQENGVRASDISALSQLTGYSEEDVSEAVLFWINVGVLAQNEEHFKSTIKAKLEIMLGRIPEIYEVNSLYETFKKTNASKELVLSILDLGKTAEKNSLEWAKNILKACTESDDPQKTLEDYEKYFSLTRLLRTGIPIERKLTTDEKKIILSWAVNRVPSNVIFNAYEICKYRTKKMSIKYMKGIIDKSDKDTVDWKDDLGY